MANIEKVSAGKEDIYSKLFEIAAKYTDTKDTEYLNTGLMGYVTESMAMMMRNSILQKDMLYKESFLNTAIMPSSIYNWAKMFNIEVNKATPAYSTINIIINLEVLKREFEHTTEIIISKDNQIIANEYYFALEHSISIEKKSNNNFVASYITDEYTSTKFQDLKSNILQTSYDENGNIIITARAYQYKINKIKRQLSSSSYSNKIQTFLFEDQFAGARLFYNVKDDTPKDEDEIALVYSNINNTNNERYAYYSLTSTNELQLTFKSGESGFIPSPNSKLDLYIYTTKGSNVPTHFSGDAFFRFRDDQLKRLGIVVTFNPTNIIGGQDAPTLEKIRQTIIKELSTCNTIVTESDLNNYFDVLTTVLETINDGKVTFIKKRDDLLRRVFNSYLLLRDGLYDDDVTLAESTFISKCVPTNTIDVSVAPSDIFEGSAESTGIAFPNFVLSPDSNFYKYKTSIGEGDGYLSPFYMIISLSPIKKVKYVYPLVNNTKSVSFQSSSLNLDNGKYLNPVSVKVFKGIENATIANRFVITFDINTNLSNDELTKNFTFEIKAGTKANPGYSILDTDSEIAIDRDNENDNLVHIHFSSKEAEFEYDSDKDENTVKLMTSNNEKLVDESGYIYLYISKNNETLTVVSDDVLYFYRELDDIMSSELELDLSGNTIKNIIIRDVPVVQYQYFNTDNKRDYSSFIEQLFVYIDLLKEYLERLETSTFFNLKFYNTYGPSYFYDTITTNLDLELRVYLLDAYKNNETLKNEIKSYIRRAIDKSNDNSAVSISSVITAVSKSETYGQYIDYIEFNGLNGTFAQRIKKIETSSVTERDAAPEWLNISYDSMKEIKFNDEE